MINLKLTQNAFFENGPQRIYDEAGNETIYIIRDYYTAQAVDENGNEYFLFWETLDDYDINTAEDDESACDWDKPKMILNEMHHDVKANVNNINF